MAAGAERSTSKLKLARRIIGGEAPDDEQDRIISHLPVELIERILCCLLLREAVRTSILSRKWRYMWTNLKHLVFDDESCTCPLSAASQHRYKSINDRVVKIMDNVLVLHRGPVVIFKLFVHELLSDKEFDTRVIHQWILYLSRMPITDFILDLPPLDRGWYDIPAYLFHCHNLVNLVLYCSSLNLPRTFRGLQNLKTLMLFNVDMSRDSLEKLISGCPQLSKLELILIAIEHITRLYIDAPNLLDIDICGLFEDISFAPNSLTRAQIEIAWGRG